VIENRGRRWAECFQPNYARCVSERWPRNVTGQSPRGTGAGQREFFLPASARRALRRYLSALHVLRGHELNPDVLAHQRRGRRRPDDPPAPLDKLDRLARLAQRDEALRQAASTPSIAFAVSSALAKGGSANDSGLSLRGGTNRSRHSLSAVTSPAIAISIALRVSASASPSSSASAASVARFRTPLGFPFGLPDWPL
jgi:hypothetical protein